MPCAPWSYTFHICVTWTLLHLSYLCVISTVRLHVMSSKSLRTSNNINPDMKLHTNPDKKLHTNPDMKLHTHNSPVSVWALTAVNLHKPGHGVVTQHECWDLGLSKETLKRSQDPLFTFHSQNQLFNGLIWVTRPVGRGEQKTKLVYRMWLSRP